MARDLANEILILAKEMEKNESMTVQSNLLIRRYTCCLDHSILFHIYCQDDMILLMIENTFAESLENQKFMCERDFTFSFQKTNGLDEMRTVCRAFVKELAKCVLMKTGLIDHYNRFSDVFLETKIIKPEQNDLESCIFATSTNLTEVFTKNIATCGTQVSSLAYDVLFENIWDAISIAVHMKSNR